MDEFLAHALGSTPWWPVEMCAFDDHVHRSVVIEGQLAVTCGTSDRHFIHEARAIVSTIFIRLDLDGFKNEVRAAAGQVADACWRQLEIESCTSLAQMLS